MLDALINTFGRHLAELFMKDRTNDSQELIEMLLSQRNYISALQDYIEASNETMQIFLSQDTSKDKLHAALEGMNEINEFKTIKLIS